MLQQSAIQTTFDRRIFRLVTVRGDDEPSTNVTYKMPTVAEQCNVETVFPGTELKRPRGSDPGAFRLWFSPRASDPGAFELWFSPCGSDPGAFELWFSPRGSDPWAFDLWF